MKTNIINLTFSVFAFTLLCIPGLAFSQTVKKGSVTGIVIDSKKAQPIEFVSVSIVKTLDSTMQVANQLANKEGAFNILNIPVGDYIIRYSFVGYKVVKKPLKITDDKPVNTGTTILEEGLNLTTVVIQGEATAVKVKEDTTVFNAAAFKAAPDATVEEGIKKLPGMEVDKDGKITANGEDVTKVTVDGKEFFGNDPKLATKNLPHDAVKSYELINDKNDKSKDTGIDDGKRSKTLNIVLKDDKKKGWFGNGSVAGGTKDRYLGSMSLNRFTNDKQFNVLMLSNNVNQIGFTSEDATNFGGGGGSSYSVSSSGSVISQTVNGVNVGNANQGLNKTNSGGVNFSDSWGKKNTTKFSGSYFGSGTSTQQETEQYTQSTQLRGLFFNNSLSNSDNSSQTHKVNIRLTARIDSLTNLTFTPSVNLGFRNSNGFNQSSQSDSVKNLINTRSGQSDNDSFNPSFNGSLSLTRRFHKQRGSVYFSFSGNSYSGSSDNINRSLNTFYQGGRAPIDINRLESQESLNDSYRFSTMISRVISKDKKTTLSFTPSVSYSRGNSDRSTLEYNPANGFYEIRLDSLTNNSTTNTTTYATALSFNKSMKKWNVNISANAQRISLEGNITGYKVNEGASKSYVNFYPEAYVTFRPKNTTSFTLSTSSYLSPPPFSYLVNTQNNSNPLYIRSGNPDLKPTQTYSAYLSFNTSDSKKSTYTNGSLSFSTTQNAISQFSSFDEESGISRSKPINVNGNYRLNASGSFTIPTKVKGLRIGPSLSFNNSRNISFINGVQNKSNQTGAGGGMNISYFYKEAINVTLTNNTRFTHIDNSARTTPNNNFFTLDNGANLSLEPIKKWRINAELVNRSAAGQNFVLLNAGIQRFLLDKNKLSFELKGFDLLNNNSDVMRQVYENSITDLRSNNLRRYFYMKLVYRVNKIGSSPARTQTPGTPVIIIR